MMSPSGANPRSCWTKKRWLVLGLLALVALVVWYHRPQWKRQEAQRTQLAQLRQRLQALQAQNAQLQKLQDQLADVQRYVGQEKEQGALLPVDRLVAHLASTFSQQGLQIRQFRRRREQSYEALREVWVDVECQGTLEQVLGVLGHLESSPQRLWIEQLQLVPDQQAPPQVRCRMVVRGFADNSGNSG